MKSKSGFSLAMASLPFEYEQAIVLKTSDIWQLLKGSPLCESGVKEQWRKGWTEGNVMDGPNGFDHQLKVIRIASSAHIPSTLTSLSIKNLKVTHNEIFPTTTLFYQGHERAVERHNKFNTSILPEKKKSVGWKMKMRRLLQTAERQKRFILTMTESTDYRWIFKWPTGCVVFWDFGNFKAWLKGSAKAWIS